VSSVAQVFERCRAEGRAALVGYLPVGYPDKARSLRAMEVLVENGVDIVEVGVPYSDPLMDGPTIQRVVAEALAGGTRVEDTFDAVRAVRAAGAVPLVMTSWNLVLRRGVDDFAEQLAAAGGAGLITPDLTPDEAGEWIAASDRTGLDRIFLAAPSSTPERLDVVARGSRGFVYAAAVMGVTGARESVGEAAEGLVARIRQHTDLPVCVGLGVSTGDQAAEIARYADGVIVGSALVSALVADGTDPDLPALAGLTRELAGGIRSVAGGIR
jgi:tryptophan synthase alpha chain